LTVACIAALAWAAAPPQAHSASPPSLVGAWHGTIANYGSTGDPERELFINADGTCHFDNAKVTRRRGPDKVECKVDHVAGTVELKTAITRPQVVTLKLAPDGTLKGWFVVNWGQPYSLTMKPGRAP